MFLTGFCGVPPPVLPPGNQKPCFADEPPRVRLRSMGTGEPETDQDDQRQLRPRQCGAEPVGDQTNPDGVEQRHNQLIGDEHARD